jgi:sugar phosphate isomerase/epimerase
VELAIGDLFKRPYDTWDAAFLRGLRAKGFRSVGLFEAPLVDLGDAGRREFKQKLDDAGLRVHSWFVICHTHVRPTDPRRPGDIDRFKRSAEYAALLSPDNVGTSPGSLDDRYQWTAHPDNLLFDSTRRVADSLAEILPFYEAAGVTFGLEFGVPTAVPTVERALWVVDALGSPNFGVFADPANQVQGYERLFRSAEVMNHFFDVLGRHVICAHGRDAWLEPGLEMHIRTGGPGDGIVDFAAFLSRVRDQNPKMSLLIEHAQEARIDAYVDYLRRICDEINLPIDS